MSAVSRYLGPGALEPVSSTCVIYPNTAHRFCRSRKKTSTIGPFHLLVAEKAAVRFVDQRGGLKGVAGGLVGHLAFGEQV